jgi:hypothetical protein
MSRMSSDSDNCKGSMYKHMWFGNMYVGREAFPAIWRGSALVCTFIERIVIPNLIWDPIRILNQF